jgi:hypothetical protein
MQGIANRSAQRNAIGQIDNRIMYSRIVKDVQSDSELGASYHGRRENPQPFQFDWRGFPARHYGTGCYAVGKYRVI